MNPFPSLFYLQTTPHSGERRARNDTAAARRNGMRSRVRSRGATGTGSDSDSEAEQQQQQRRRKGGGNGRSASESSVARQRPASLEAAAAAVEGSAASNSFHLKDSGISDVVTNSPDENSAADVADNTRFKFGAETRSNGAGER